MNPVIYRENSTQKVSLSVVTDDGFIETKNKVE